MELSAEANQLPIEQAAAMLRLCDGELSGGAVQTAVKRLGELGGVFADRAAWAAMDPDTPVYRVQTHRAEREGTPGGLFFGTSFVYPGVVGAEYFMTRGHFHERSCAAEYYWGVSGEGILLKMTRERIVSAERVTVDSLHYIPGHVAHRLVNTGEDMLVVGACWPADAGYDYDTIARQGFGARVLRRGGLPIICREETT
jgi:glucose-6-phosphate isomerase